jgi:hypothetical protein
MEQDSEGYLGSAYINSLAQFGRVLELPASGGGLLVRQVPGQARDEDACGAYPLFCCRDWRRLAGDIAALKGRLLSCVVVTDPFGGYTLADLDAAFPDLVMPFKEHFIVELDGNPESIVQAHHRYYARKALRDYRVTVCADPLRSLERWNRLYAQLVQRHRIRGMAAFSPESFRRQFQVPGVRVLIAERDGVTEGMQLWFRQGDVAYHHLSAYSEVGYRSRVSYALMWSALQGFAESGVRRLDLGGAAGDTSKDDGLTRFKRGWSNAGRDVYLCGRILNEERYAELVGGMQATGVEYFPQYRAVTARDGV